LRCKMGISTIFQQFRRDHIATQHCEKRMAPKAYQGIMQR
jgi:hypothetical protein